MDKRQVIGTFAYTVLLLYPNEDPPQTYLAHVFSENAGQAVKDARAAAVADNEGLIEAKDFDCLLVINSFRDDLTPESDRPS